MTKPPEPVVTGELKPCPFCGGDPRTKFHGLEQTWSVKCGQCQAQMPYVGLSEAEAIADWNTRTAHALPGDVGMLHLAKTLLLAIDGIEAHCRNDAGLKGEDHAADGRRVRHAMNLLAEEARQQIAANTPSALSGDAGEGE